MNNRLHYLIICTYNEGQLMHILLVIHMRHSYNTQPHHAVNRMHEGYEALLAILRLPDLFPQGNTT